MILSNTLKPKISYYLRNYKILLTSLDSKIIKGFLKPYINFLFEYDDIYVNSLLLECNLIGSSLFNRLEDLNYSILELARTTEFELSQNLDINIRKALSIKLIAQFHYSTLLNGLTIYYAHPMVNYVESIELKELRIILSYFPFADIINPSKLDPLWEKYNCTQSEIMDHCLDIVSEVDIVIFSPANEHSISKGVFEEISLANSLNIPTYLLHKDRLQDYILGKNNEQDWRNYCGYKAISLLDKGMTQSTSEYEIEFFLKINKNLIKEKIVSEGKKYLIICNTTLQTETVINTLLRFFSDSKIKILPILGKHALCKIPHANTTCESCNKYKKKETFNFINVLRENVLRHKDTGLIEAIKTSTPENLCPYLMLYEFVSKANIIVINKVFFKSIRLRTKLRKEIIFDSPYKFILIFDDIKDLFSDHIENRCSDKDLIEGLTLLSKIDYEEYKRASSIIKNLLDLKEEEKLDVDYFLTKFLIKRYQNRRENTNLLENIYDICKTPFGHWHRRGGEIIQIISSKSLKNFLNYFFEVYLLKSKNRRNLWGH